MGRTADENVPTTNDPNPSSVKLSQLRADYEAGLSPQELSDKYNVDTDVIIDKLDLYSLETKEQRAEKPAETDQTEE